VLITLDAVGGVWRYALDVARGLEAHGVACLLVGFGPEPSLSQRAECGDRELVWTGEPLDWMIADSSALDAGTRKLAILRQEWKADVLHLNLPSQAAGLPSDIPVVVASHSCVPTWWQAVRGTDLPPEWVWLRQRNQDGFQRANLIVVPTESHGAALRGIYDQLPPLRIAHNATAVAPGDTPKEPLILSVGRWWDAGKNGWVLDAASSPWPIVLAGPVKGPDGQRATFRNSQTVGALPHEDVLALMRRAAIFAAPSRYEPFGLAVVEAAINGTALVLADIPTFRELWDGAALFVPPNDIRGWSNAFAELATNVNFRHQLSKDAAARGRQFSLPRQAARFYEAYSSLMASAVPA
jgi:glycosyltransferase involved in cell wall biosynthesis